MFSPKLGVSLHTLAPQIDDALLAALRDSTVATLEVTPQLFEGQGGEARKAALLQALAETGIRVMTIHALFGPPYDWSKLDQDAAASALAAFDRSLALAVDLGAPMIVVHASSEPVFDEERTARLACAYRALGQIGARCQEQGKRVAVELLPRTCLGHTAAELLELLDGLGPHFGVCLDTNHLMDRPDTLAETVRQLGERLITLHLSDYDGIDEKHQPPGAGVLDWPAFMAALDRIGYAGPFNYECRLPGETSQERVQALEANFRWLAKLAPEEGSGGR